MFGGQLCHLIAVSQAAQFMKINMSSPLLSWSFLRPSSHALSDLSVGTPLSSSECLTHFIKSLLSFLSSLPSQSSLPVLITYMLCSIWSLFLDSLLAEPCRIIALHVHPTMFFPRRHNFLRSSSLTSQVLQPWDITTSLSFMYYGLFLESGFQWWKCHVL